MKYRLCVLILIALCCLSGGCTPASVDSQQLEDTEHSDVVKGTAIKNTYSVENAGIFYIGRNNTLLMYYDYNTDESYVLCSSPNCKHQDSSCPANVADNYKNYTFAYYNGKEYLLRKEDFDSDEMELISMDPGGQNQKTIAVLDTGDYSVNTWTVDSVLPVYFSGNRALLEIDYTKTLPEETQGGFTATIQGRQLLMIELENGKVTQLTDILEYSVDYASLSFCAVMKDYAVYEVMKYDEPYMLEWEYIREYGEDAFNKEYSEYYENYMNNTDASGIYKAVDLRTGAVSEIWSGDMFPSYTEGDSYPVMMGPWFILEHDGKILCRLAEDVYGEQKSDMILYSIDPATGKETQTISFSKPVDELWYTEQNSNGEYLYREDEMLVCNHDLTNEDSFRLYKYSFSTGTLTELWDEYVYSDIYGMTDELVIWASDDNLKLSYVTKEDYEKKNFEDAKKVKFDW